LAPVGTISFLSTPRSDFLPGVALAFGAALWGLFWIPIRGIEQVGMLLLCEVLVGVTSAALLLDEPFG
jgi:hypothetical protein